MKSIQAYSEVNQLINRGWEHSSVCEYMRNKLDHNGYDSGGGAELLVVYFSDGVLILSPFNRLSYYLSPL